MTDIVQLRCSGLPLNFICAESARGAGFMIDRHNDEGVLGSAVHALMELVVALAPRHTSELPVSEIAATFGGVDVDEMGRLAWSGIQAWQTLRARLPSDAVVSTEVSLRGALPGGVILTGHIDVLGRLAASRTALVIDWKTGRVDRSYLHQLMGYAWLVMNDDHEIDVVQAHAVWLRDSEIQPYTVTREHAAAWARRLDSEILQASPAASYTTGAHCAHCPRAHECPALLALAKRDVGLFGNVAMQTMIETGLADMPDQQIVDLHRRSKIVLAMCESLDEAVKREVVRRGTLDAGDGNEYRMREDPRRCLDVAAAWPVLETRLDANEMIAGIKLSISKLEEAVAAKAPKRGGAAAKRDLNRALEDAGAVRVDITRKLVDVKKS